MRARALGASALLYVAVTAVLGRDVLARAGTSIANDAGDPLLTAAILQWNATHVPFTDAWWQFPIFHPTRDALAFSEHLLGLSVIAAPIAWITGNPLLTYNITLLLTFPLSALAMYALVHRLASGSRGEQSFAVEAGACAAGLAYAFAPYRISNLPHIQMLASFWAPLALLGLHGFLDSARPRLTRTAAESALHEYQQPVFGGLRDVAEPSSRTRRQLAWLALFGAAWTLQAAANWYALVFLSVLVGLWVLWFVVVPRNWGALAAIAAATGVAALPLLPILYRYITVHGVHGFERSLGEMRTYSADVGAVLCAPPALSVWGWIRVTCRAEGELFPGAVTFVLFLAALYWVLADRTTWPSDATTWRISVVVSRVLLAVALLFAVIVGSVLVAGPWAFDAGVFRVSASEVDKPLLVSLVAAVAALLLALGTRAFSRRSTHAAAFYLFAALVTWALALGPTLTLMHEMSGRPGPFALLQWLPGISGLRVPARFWLMTTLCLAVGVGLVIERLLRGRGAAARRGAFIIATIALLADGWAEPIPAQPVPDDAPAPAMLAGNVTLQLPTGLFPDIAATWRAVTGGWRTVNGYSGYEPNYYQALRVAAQAVDPALLAPFRRDGDLHVIVADDAADAREMIESQSGVVTIGRRNGMTQYRLPRLNEPPHATASGEALEIVAVRSTCNEQLIGAVLDNDDTSRWECLEDATQHHITMDLGRPVVIASLVYSQGPYSVTVPESLDIATSMDGLTWMPAPTGSLPGGFIEHGLANPRSLRTTLSFPDRAARYVRLRPVTPLDEFAWFVTELRVHAP